MGHPQVDQQDHLPRRALPRPAGRLDPRRRRGRLLAVRRHLHRRRPGEQGPGHQPDGGPRARQPRRPRSDAQRHVRQHERPARPCLGRPRLDRQGQQGPRRHRRLLRRLRLQAPRSARSPSPPTSPAGAARAAGPEAPSPSTTSRASTRTPARARRSSSGPHDLVDRAGSYTRFAGSVTVRVDDHRRSSGDWRDAAAGARARSGHARRGPGPGRGACRGRCSSRDPPGSARAGWSTS